MSPRSEPTCPIRNGVALVATGVVLCAYFVALHALIVERSMPWLVLAMVLFPWFIAIAVLAAKRWRSGSGTVRAAVVAIAVLVGVSFIGTSRDFGAALVSNADFVVYVEYVVFFAWLSTLFAASLASSGEPLVTRMARKARRGDMPPEVVRYTRQVTFAWALFFAGAIVVSSLLFFAGSRAAWSLFVNLLIWPLVIIGFVVEYPVRISVLRTVNHIPLMAGMRAFWERDVASKPAVPR